MPRLLSILLLCAVGCTSGAADTPRSSLDDLKAIRSVLESQREAWNQGDLERFMSAGYVKSDDLVFTSGGVIRRGYAPTLERYRSRYEDAAEMGKLTFEDLAITKLGPTAAWVLGRFTLEDTPEAGTGIFTLVFVKTKEGWRILHDHTSADASS